MSEPRTISQLVNEVTDKTGRTGDYLAIEEEVVAGSPITRKIKLSTILAGVLAPNDLAQIDVDENSLINVKDIDCEEITATQLELTGNALNKVNPLMSFSIDNTTSAITNIDSAVLSGWQTEASPPGAMTGNYLEIPYIKCEQIFRLEIGAWGSTATDGINVRYYVYNGSTYTDTFETALWNGDNTEIIDNKVYKIFSGNTPATLNPTDTIRIFISSFNTNPGVDYARYWAIQ